MTADSFWVLRAFRLPSRDVHSPSYYSLSARARAANTARLDELFLISLLLDESSSHRQQRTDWLGVGRAF